MLSFLSGSFVTSTQRFLSFYIGKGDLRRLPSVFSDCVTIHVLIGLFLTGVLFLLTPFVFNGLISIPSERLAEARLVYWLVVAMLFFTFTSSPFRAAIISREDIVFISVLDVIDGVLKVLLALWLSVISFDKLVGYGYAMLFVQFFNFVALIVFSICRYAECKEVRIKRISRPFVKELLPFVGWTIYSQGCIIGRTQGFAVLLSRFVSIVANAAFGIALQLLSFVSFISSSVLNALQPQIVKAEGAGDRARLIKLSGMSSKCSFLLLAAVVLPVCYYISDLLSLWLVDVPEHTAFFCIMVFITALLDSLTIGLGLANQALGNIRNYSIIVNTTKLFTLVPVWITFVSGCPLVVSASIYCGFEFLSALLRLPCLKYTAGISIRSFIRTVFFSVSVPFAFYCIILYLLKCRLLCNMFIAIPVSLAIYLCSVYFFSLDKEEKKYVRDFVRRILIHR